MSSGPLGRKGARAREGWWWGVRVVQVRKAREGAQELSNCKHVGSIDFVNAYMDLCASGQGLKACEPLAVCGREIQIRDREVRPAGL